MELPLRLLVAAIVVGITMPMILSGLSAYEAQQVSARTAQAIEGIVRLAQRLYLSGGGADHVRVDFTGGVTAAVEHVAIGDAAGSVRATSARYKLVGMPEVFLLSDPPVPMAGSDGPLWLGPGRFVVRVAFDGDGPVRLAAV